MAALSPDAVATSTALTVASPIAGDYAIIVIAAVLGASVALSRVDTTKNRRKWDGALYIFRSVAISVAFTGLAAGLLSKWLNHDIAQLLFPVAFFIARLGDDGLSMLIRLLAKRAEGG